MTALRKVAANRASDSANFLMCGRDNQNTPGRIGGHLPVEISNRPATLGKGNLVHSAKPFQLLKTLFGSLAQGLNGVSILRVRLTLYAGQGDAFHLRFALQYAQCVGRLDTLNLACVAREKNPRHFALGQLKNAVHLPSRDHSRLIDNQDLATERRLRRFVLKKA